MYVVLLLALTPLLCAIAPASAEPLDLATVIRTTLQQHPDMPLSQLQVRFARVDQQRIHGLLDPQISASLLTTDDENPSNSKFNPIRSAISRQIKGEISKPLENGDTVILGMDYSQTNLKFEFSSAAFARFDPFYHNQIDLTYRHPLLRGSDRPDFGQELKAALADESAANLQRAVVARNLTRQAIQFFFDVVVDETNRKLSADTVERAEKLVLYQKSREKFGLIEKADRLQAEALLATRQLELARAEANLIQDRTALNRLMLRDPEIPLSADYKQRLYSTLPDLKQAIETASGQRPELLAISARLEAAEARLQVANDRDHAQLDIVGQLGSRSLSGSYGTSLKQGFSLSDRFASIGIEFSDTITNNAAKAAIRKAALEREQIFMERRQTYELIKDDVAKTLSRIRTGRKTYAAAEHRQAAEQAKFYAELDRYRESRSETSTMIQFEGDLRAAEIEAALRRIALLRDQRQLSWVQGTLARELGIAMPGSQP